jgi:hypothetical protein
MQPFFTLVRICSWEHRVRSDVHARIEHSDLSVASKCDIERLKHGRVAEGLEQTLDRALFE